MILVSIARKSFGGIVAVTLTTGVYAFGQTRSAPEDPGVRGGLAGAGAPLKGLTADETAFFQDGQARFADVEVVTKGSNNGLGPRFNSNQCLSCHSQPDAGGSSPAQNPLIAVATLNGAKNTVPWFITQNGPIREARFKRSANGVSDGEVHNLFVITGRTDAPGCNIAHPDFSLWRGAHRSDSRLGHRCEYAIQRIGEVGIGYFRARECSPKRKCEPQCKRWDHYAFRVEGTEQIPSHVRGRSIQRRDGHHEPTVSAGARRNAWLPL